MVYALIKQGFIKNIIVADDDFIATISGVRDAWDYIAKIDTLKPCPQIGWRFDGANFIHCEFDQMESEIVALNGADNPNAYNQSVDKSGKAVVAMTGECLSWLDKAHAIDAVPIKMAELAQDIGKVLGANNEEAQAS